MKRIRRERLLASLVGAAVLAGSVGVTTQAAEALTDAEILQLRAMLAGTETNQQQDTVILGQRAKALKEAASDRNGNTEVTSDGAVSIGTDSSAAGNKSVAIGADAKTGSRYTTVAVNGSTNRVVALDKNADGAVAIGNSAHAFTAGSVALGRNAKAGESYLTQIGTVGIAIGDGAQALAVNDRYAPSDDAGIAVGRNAIVKGNLSLVIGTGAYAEQGGNILIGANAKTYALKDNSQQDTVHPLSSVGIGTNVEIRGRQSLALGKEASVGRGLLYANPDSTGEFDEFNGVALGYKASALRPASVSLGALSGTERQTRYLDKANWTLDESVKYKTDQIVIAPYSDTKLRFTDSQTLGQSYYALNERLGQQYVYGVVSVGGAVDGTMYDPNLRKSKNVKVPFLRQIVNLADGTEDTDAVNLRQLKGLENDFKTKLSVLSGGGWNLKVPSGGNITIEKNDTVTFDVEEKDKGLTVARDGKTIKYGVDGGKIDLSNNTAITNLTEKINKAGDAIHYVSINSTENGAGSNFDNKGATGADAIAIGKDVSAAGKRSVSIGEGITKNNGNFGIAIGATGNSSEAAPEVKGEHGIAIGSAAVAEGQGIAIGLNAKNTAGFSTAIGAQSESGYLGNAMGYAAKAKGKNSVAIGLMSIAKTDDSAAYGRQAQALGNVALAVGMQAIAQGNHSAVFGAGATTDSTAVNGTAIGRRAYIGKQSPEGTTPDTGVSDNYFTPVEDDTAVAEGKETMNSTAVGFGAKSYGYQNTALGAGAEAFDTNTVAVGVMSKAIGHYANAMGKQARAEGRNANAIGHWARALGESSLAIGDYSITAQLDGKKGVAKSAAIGSHARAAVDNSVALGTNSLANIADDVATKAYLSEEAFAKENGVVSVGNEDYTIGETNIAANYRRITNVAGGAADHDAVNVLQLKALAAKVAEVGTQAGKRTIVKVDGEENVTDGNLTIKKTETDGQVTYDLSLNNELVIGKDGKDGKIGLNGKDGVSADIQVKNGSAGVDGKDGITRIVYKDQDGKDHEVATLDDGLKFKGDNDTVITRKLNQQLAITGGISDATELSDNNIGVVGTADGRMAVKLAKSLKGLQSAEFKDGDKVTNITAGDVTIKDGDTTISLRELGDKITNIDTTIEQKVDAAKITVKGDTDSGVKVTEVKTGDKVTGYKVGLDDTVKVGNVAIDGKGDKGEITGLTNTTLDAEGFATKGRAATEEQLQAAMNKAITGSKTTVTAGDNITVTEDAKTNTYTVALNEDITAKSVTAGKAKISDDGVSYDGKTYIGKDGLNANGKKVTNVAAGTLSKDSTDAVNGSQLFATNENVTANTKNIENNAKQITNLNQNVTKLGGAIGELRDESREGDALNAALAALKPLDFDPLQRSQMMAGVGYYRGKQAVALGLSHYSNEDTLVHAGISYAGSSELMANAGISWRFGSKDDRELRQARKERLPQYAAGPMSSVYVMQDEVARLQAVNAEQDSVIARQSEQIAALEEQIRRITARLG